MSQSGQAVRIPMNDVRVMGRSTQGVRLVNLREGKDFVASAQKIEAVAEADIVEAIKVAHDAIKVQVQAQLDLADKVGEKATVKREVEAAPEDEEIKAAVEGVFGVKVKAVNTLRQQGKQKRFRGKMGKRPDFKKAIITLVEGEMIDITTGV